MTTKDIEEIVGEAAKDAGMHILYKKGAVKFPKLRLALTTLTQHHEAEMERYKAALEDINSVTPADAERWGYYETLNKIVGRTNEALTPTKTDKQTEV